MSEDTNGAPLVSVENLVKEYPSGQSMIRVLDGITLDVSPSNYLSIIGPSGVGKTTLLNVIGLLDPPTSGTIRVGDREATRLSDAERSRIRNQTFGFVYQFYHLIPELSALENVLLPGMISSGPISWLGDRREFQDRAQEMLDEVGLADRASHRPGELSGGERQRVAIARALLLQPAVLLCDEPTGNLDRETGQRIQDLIERLRAEHETALVVATHDEDLADRAERKMQISSGKLAPVSG